jgi:hypothetical protein
LENEFENKNKSRISERQFEAMGGWGEDPMATPGDGFGGNLGQDDFFNDASWNQ